MNDASSRLLGALFLSAVALVATGCAEAPPPSKPAVVFPTRAEIEAIPAAKPNIEAFGQVDTTAEPWAVQVEPSTTATPYVDTTPWGDFLRAAVKPHARTVTLSAALKCAGDELAKVSRTSTKILPPLNLARFVVARCGAMVNQPRPLVWKAEAPSAMTDDAIIVEAKKQLAPALEKALAGAGHVVVGMGVARDDKGVSVVAILADDEAALDPTPLRADENRLVTIRGTVRGQYESIYALVNRGALGVAECEKQGDLPPPHFAFTCKLADGDPYAWVELLGKQRGVVLARDLAAGIVVAGNDAPIVYKPRSDAAPLIVHSAADLSTAITAGVNRARATAHLPPLTLDPKQSVQNTRLSGTLINAAFGEDTGGGADRAAIGLLAGWDVAGMIRGATIFVGAIAATNDATAWIDWALEWPSGRLTLLKPESRVIAIGPVVPQEGAALGAAVTTYALFESDDHAADEAALFARIQAARAARGLPPAVRLGGIPEMHDRAVRVLSEGDNPMSALQAMLTAATARTGSSTRGYVLETTDVDHFKLPDIAVAPGNLQLALAVTHHRPEGAAWGQYVVFLVGVGADVTTSPSLEAKSERTGNVR